MQINIERLQKINKENSRLLGITSIVLNNSLVVENVRIIMGDKGPFIAMPSRKADNSFVEIVYPTTQSLRMQIEKVVLDGFLYGKYEPGMLEKFCVTEVKVKKISNPETNLKAFASVLLNNEFVIHDIKIVEDIIDNKKTTRIYMPTWKEGEQWRNLAYAIDKELLEEILNKVFDEFKRCF